MVVVTGATGHIGNVLVRELVASAIEVRALAPSFEDTTPLAGLDVEIVEGDVLDCDSLLRAFAGADVVYHLAGVISITPGKRDLLYDVNVTGARNVAQACLDVGVRRLVHTSSIHALSEPPQGTVIDESRGFDPESQRMEYSKTKAQGTLEALAAVDQGLDAVIVCPTGVIGPYDFKPSEMGQLFIDFASGRIKAYIDGAYDFVDVRDVAHGLILAAEKGRRGEVYILSGEQITVPALMSILERLTGVHAPRVKLPAWFAEATADLGLLYYRMTNTRPLFTRDSIRTLTSNSLVSSAKARRELSYTARPIRESIADSVRWLKENGLLERAA
jgi:dihydroflavonol-4-reductase